MSYRYIDLTSTAEHTTVPIAHSIYKDVAMYCGIPESYRVIFLGEVKNDVFSSNTTDSVSIGERRLRSRVMAAGGEPSVTVELEEKLVDGSFGHTATWQMNNNLVLNDPVAGFGVKLVTVTTQQNITLSISSDSFNTLSNINKRMLSRAAMGFGNAMHGITYTIALPSLVNDLVEHIGALRGNCIGEAVSSDDYMQAIADSTIAVVRDTSGTTGTWGMVVTQGPILGNVDSEVELVGIKRDESNGMYALAINYKIEYEKPIGMIIHTYALTYNELLPDWAIAPNKIIPATRSNNMTYAESAYSTFANPSYKLYDAIGSEVVRIPDFDREEDAKLRPDLVPLCVMLLTVDSDRKTMLDMRDLGEYALSPQLIQWLVSSERNYLFSYGQSLFHLSLSINERTAYSSTMILNSDGVVKSMTALEPCKRHRLTLSLFANADLLNAEYLKRLPPDGELRDEILNYMEMLADTGSSPLITSIYDKWVTDIGDGKHVLNPIVLNPWGGYGSINNPQHPVDKTRITAHLIVRRNT